MHPLTWRQEGDEWIVGRVETGTFVALPPVGLRFIELVNEGHTITDVKKRLLAEFGKEFDTDGFLGSLRQLGFVDEVDGDRVITETPKCTFARVRPHHVRWLMHPATGWATALVIAASSLVLAFNRELIPRATDMMWTDRGSIFLLSQAIVAWGSIFPHELAHLFTARAVGVPGRMHFSTRLQFLCAQTDVSSIWSAPRATRMVVYLSGMAVNAVIASIGVWILCLPETHALHRFGALIFLTQVVLLANQFLFFMRTDIYFAVQDLAGCRNLYRDASLYCGYLVRRIAGRAEDDPTRRLPARERRIVRGYAVFFVPSSVICVSLFLLITLPVIVQLLTGALGQIAAMESVTGVVDGAIVLAILVTGELIWARAWWRRHHARVISIVARLGSRLRRYG
ncbi:PqqD family protein [Nonomuraea turkmeniaca]|uniref:PqqD family protein n=1 Tax=Nonomuraea turkmeniaca TaxID=103838 RepID=A0A5S4EZ07_9ACTN|nr:PqqD family protein [Nonomuraea turkmeniaca]TMR08979.1 PqqD family protein [Nonomuraea turkmeniaca]